MSAGYANAPTREKPLVQPLDQYNRALLDQVHPTDWPNPTPAKGYNLVVIGAGAGGLVSALGAAGLGAKVALVEKDRLGGDCLNVGCVPSKALLRSARAFADVREAGGYGVRVPDCATIDFPAVMERMRRLRARISCNDSANRLREAGVDVFFGEGRFTGNDAIEVDGRILRFSRAIIAAGARPAIPDIAGLADAGYLTNETVFWLTELPKRLAVIGAGPIGCELTQAFARFGSNVHLLAGGFPLLGREDRDAAKVVEMSLSRDGVSINHPAKVIEVRRDQNEKILVLNKGSQRTELRVDEILIATGRQPNVDTLNLEAAAVKYDTKKGVFVSDRLQTSNRRIFGVGDICSKYKFTHMSDAMARIALQNALFFGRGKSNILTVPWCTYTDPEVAHVGEYENESRNRGMEIDTFTVELKKNDRAIVDGEELGFLKVHVKKGSDKILGATLVARHAGEMISQITQAMSSGQGLKALSKTIYCYPTQAEIIKSVANEYQRTRLTPWLKWALEKWLAWRR